MNKDKVIEILRRGQEGVLIYHFYIEECERRGLIPFDTHKFFPLFNMWGGKHKAFEYVLNYYLQKFDIHTLLDSKGNFVKYL